MSQWPRAVAWIMAIGLAPGCRPSQPRPSAANEAPDATPWFRDVTDAVGLRFQHDAGPRGDYFMPEQMGSGGAFLDYNLDGRLDVFLAQCGGPESASTHRLYQQQPDGTLRDVSAGSGLDGTGYGMGAAVGDVNNDRYPDVLVTEYRGVRLFLNEGGTHFRDVTADAGLDNPRWATAAAFLDYDRDGWLDCVVANYLDYDPTQRCVDPSGRPEFCGPHGFPGVVTRLFRNVGGDSGKGGAIRFEDVTVSAGMAAHPGPALGILCCDFDGNGWQDVFLADDGRPNRLFMNQGNGTFKEEAAVRGLAYNAMGQTAGDMGVAMGDADGDGMFDLFVTHLAEEQHSLWKQGPRGLFQDQYVQSGLTGQRWRGTGFGAVMVDFDADGNSDIAWVNGRVKRGDPGGPVFDEVAAFWRLYAQRAQLFSNEGEAGFRDLSESNPDFCARALVGRGLAGGDFDNDGDWDLLVTGTGGPARIYRNEAPRRGHWLMVRLIDPALGGRDAYGAEVVVRAADRQWWHCVAPNASYLSSHDPRLAFGLGSVSRIDAAHVTWPDGYRERFAIAEIDRSWTLERGRGGPDTGP